MYTINIADFGAKTDYSFDNAPVFQAAIDQLVTSLNSIRTANPASRVTGTIIVPQYPNPYYFNSPVWVDSPFIKIQGEGEGSVISTHGGMCHPLFILGLKRNTSILSKYRPSSIGKLDNTVGQRYGFRSYGETIIQCQANPLSCGPLNLGNTATNWYGEKTLCLEMSIEAPDSGMFPANIPIVGIGINTKALTYPISIYSDGVNHFIVLFSTQKTRFGPSLTHRFEFSTSKAIGVQRITIQIDLNNHIVNVFLNGLQINTNNFFLGDISNCSFTENDFFPLLIADQGGARPALGMNNGYDFSLYGFCLSRTIRYVNKTPGQIQTKTDGSVISDLYRYFTPRSGSPNVLDPGTIGYFAFDSINGRELKVLGGGAANYTQSSAFLIHSLQTTGGGISSNRISNLLVNGGFSYGQNIAVGQNLELTFNDLRSVNAYHAIGSLNNGANYTVRLNRCYLDGTDSGYYALDQSVIGSDITFAGAGRVTMRFVGCEVNLEHIFVEFAPTYNQSTVAMHDGDYGGNYSFRNVTVDYEGNTYNRAPFYIENHIYNPMTTLRLQDVYLGSVGKVPLVIAKSMGQGYKPAQLIIDNIQVYQPGIQGVVQTNGSEWNVNLKNIGALAPFTPDSLNVVQD